MKKSFKKAIAVLLAVLMVAFSVPFTALAAPGDYKPNINMMFGTFHSDSVKSWTDYTVAAGSTFDFCSLYDAPLTYDAQAGTLTLEAAKANKAAETTSFDTLDADYTYKVGDYFTATVVLEDVNQLWCMMASIKYSDNIEPAGVYTYRDGRANVTAIGTVSEASEKNSSNFTIGGTSPLTDWSACSYYNKGINVLGGSEDDLSVIYPEENRMEAADVNKDGSDTVDISSVYDELFANPETGDCSEGYTYEGTAIMETFVFKITGDGAITFEVADPNDEMTGFTGGYYIAKLSEGATTDKYTTYAPNGDNPGSCKMTFFGKNIHAGGPTNHSHTYTVQHVDATCEDDAKDVYTCDNSDGLGEVGDDSYEDIQEHTALGHDFTSPECVIIPNNDNATHTVQCLRYDKCNTVDDDVACTSVPDDEVNKEATSCTDGGWEGATKCQVCGQKLDAGQATDPLAHTPIPDTDKNKPATCESAGWENATKCQNCGTPIDEGNEIAALNHAYTGAVDHFDSTGHYRQCVRYDDCSSVSEVAEPHNMQQIEAEQPAGPGVPGKTAVMKCDACDYQTGGDVIPAEPIPGATHNVTVVSTPLGSTTLQYVKGGEPQSVTINAAEYNTQSVTVQADNDTQITLTASPNDDVEFVGWMVNSSILNANGEEPDNPHTATVLADITYEPVFRENESSAFTVVFTDKFGNVFNTQTVTSGEDIVIPDGPVYKGYTFTSWSMTEEEIKALTSAATIYAKYDRNVEETFTVTATGATITTPYSETQDTNTGIGYNTQVTVKADGAKVWKIDGAVVGYGESYTFYVGADVELTFETGAVTETPVVAAISTEKIGAPGNYKASFLASRNVVDGYTYVNAGFVYGMNQEVSDLTLANVNQSTIRAYYCTTDSEQFVLNVGASSQSGKIVARAFLAYVDPAEEGTTKVIYADFDAFDYAEV